MKDVLFGHSYYLRYDPKLYRAMQPYPPLGTLYAAAYIRERGYDVALFDAMLADGPHQWAAALDQHKPRYAVIYEDNFNYLSKMSLLRMRQAAQQMIAAAKQRGCTVIVCGADMTDHPRVYLQAGADVAIHGEGEATLADLLAAFEADNDLATIQGIAYMDGDQLIETLPRPVITSLDALPFPAWDLIAFDQYRDLWQTHHGYVSMNLITTRGCPFHCNWCAKPIWGQRYNARSPQNVADEMLWLQEHFQPDHIWFMDDIMGINDKWIERFADELAARQLHIPFKSLNRADLLLRGDTIPALARAGADIVWLGAESGSQKILDAMDKGTTVEQIYQATRQCHAHGIKVAFFLQFGYPGETRADIDLTLQMVRDLLPDDIGISVSYPLPGTPFHERVRDELRDRANWIDSDDLAMLYQGPFATPFYRQLHTVVHKDYRSRKTWRDLRQGRFSVGMLRRVAAMLYHRLTLPAATAKLDRLAQAPHAPTAVPNVALMD
jgi:anaerobic magnesium-protoporphyrin IX monomethyl ester cyclase